jgi:hypothetical protein
MNDQQAGVTLEAMLELAVAVRDDGPGQVEKAARRVLDAAGGDPLAAVTVAAALINVDRPVDTWWQQGLDGLGQANDDRCGTLAGYRAHQRRGEPPCQSCRHGRALDEAHRRRVKRRECAA